ncbi:MAG: hypothetical protein M3496_10345 [Pseudomonadota bacterium]|nr:hypothetical protein [Pseudomonadota bacterium]
MIDTHEPKDGDFIAYIEQLQKESAARLLASTQHLVTQLDKKPSTGASKTDHFFVGHKPADLRSAGELRASVAQAAAQLSPGQVFASGVLIATGVVLALYWLIASTSIAPLVIGAALMFWGVRRFSRALKKLSPQQANQALVSKVFSAGTTKAK